jgi:hypothetical protein
MTLGRKAAGMEERWSPVAFVSRADSATPLRSAQNDRAGLGWGEKPPAWRNGLRLRPGASATGDHTTPVIARDPIPVILRERSESQNPPWCFRHW